MADLTHDPRDLCGGAISACGPAFLRVVLDSDENTPPPAAVAAWAISMPGLCSRQLAFQCRAARQWPWMPLQPDDAQNLYSSRDKRMSSTSQPQRTTRSCWGNPMRDGFSAKLFQARPEEVVGSGGGDCRGGEPASIHHSCCAGMGNFKCLRRSGSLVGSATEALADFDLNACSGNDRTARMASLDGGPRLDSARLFCQTLSGKKRRSALARLPRKRGRSTAARR